jgi:hypothetical protein
MHNGREMKARLARNNPWPERWRWIVCSGPNCGTRLAKAHHPYPYECLRIDGSPVPIRGNLPYVSVGQGWKLDDGGIWMRTKHASKKVRHDFHLTSGDPFASPEEAERARRRLQIGSSAKFRRQVGHDRALGEPHADFVEIDLPAKIKCPDCDRLMDIEMSILEWPDE